MNLLALDTSTQRASIALRVHNQWFHQTESEIKRHAEWILPAIQDLLSEAQIQLSALDGLIFGQGPGSFTGLRVACSVAKGLAYGADLPLYPVSGLASIAHQVNEEHVLAVIDARMQAWYWAGFKAKQAVTEEQVTSPAEIFWAERSFVLAGIGFQAGMDALPAKMLAGISDVLEIYPCAKSMIEMVELNEVTPISALDARPQYIRQQVT